MRKNNIVLQFAGFDMVFPKQRDLGFLLVLFSIVRTLFFADVAFAQTDTVLVDSREELIKSVGNAKPGTVIRVASGKYNGGLMFTNLHGEKERPIVIRAADKNSPPVFIGGRSGIQLTRPRFVELRNLEFRGAEGNGVNVDDGGQADSAPSQLVLFGLKIFDVGPRGNRDGIKLSGVKDFRVENCQIERWGDGGSAIDMVGCHQGVIQNCRFKYRGDLFANGVQTKGGSANIQIKRCRFDHAGGRAVNIGGSTGKEFYRPRNANYEARNIVVEDCTIIGSMSPIAFVGADSAEVRHNTIYNPGRWVIRILQETQSDSFVPCRKGRFANNLVVFSSSKIRSTVNVGSGTLPKSFEFEENHWYCSDSPVRSNRLQLPTSEKNGTYGLDPKMKDPAGGDFSLKSSSPVKNAGVRPITKED